jgi:transposase
MIHIKFTEEAIKELQYERYHHPHPRVQRKMEALFLKSQGISHGEIGRLTGVSQVTLREYLREYADCGIEALKEVKFYRPKSELYSHKSNIEEEFTKSPASSIKEAADKIEKITGIRRSENRVRIFLKKTDLNGLK